VINNRTLYAIRALCELAESENFSSTAESIAESQNISKKFLPQILSDLARIGIVKSTRGFGGGVSLTRPPKDIHLLEVIEAIQGNIFIYDALLGREDQRHPASNKLMNVFKKIQQGMTTELSKVSLANLTSRSRPKRRKTKAKAR
jgi:Rrf2 family protein